MLLPGAGQNRIRFGATRAPDRGLLLLSWSALVLGVSRQHGDYNPSGLALVGTGLLLAFAACTGHFRSPIRWAFLAAAVVVAASPIQAGPANHGHGVWYACSRVCAWFAAAAVVGCLRWQRLFGAALALVALAALLRILATPTPPIDVHFLLTDSTRGLLEGRDLYRQSWPGSDGLRDEYPYLPWTSVLLLPAWILTHEVRVGLLAAVIVAAVAARRLASCNGHAAPASRVFLPLLLVAYPLFAYQIQQSWTEPLLLALLTVMVLAVQRGRLGWATVALALALATKQHVVLVLPFAAWWPAFGWRRTLTAIGLGVALIAPWLIAGPRDLWDDAVLLNVHYPVLRRALDVPALADRHGVTLGFGVTLLVVLAAYAVPLACLRRDAAGFAAGAGLVELALDVFNKQSFFNHYTLAMGLFVTALVSGGGTTSAGDGEMSEGRRLVDAGA